MGITRLRTPAPRAVLAVLTVAALAIPILLASSAHATGEVQGVVTRAGGAPIPLAADPSIGVKACADGSSSADCPTVAITSATTEGVWNLPSLPGDADYDLWVVNLGNTQFLGGPFDVHVDEGGTATAPRMEIEVAILQGTVTYGGAPFPDGTAGVLACINGESAPNCPSLRSQHDFDGNGTVALAVPPGDWAFQAFTDDGARPAAENVGFGFLADGSLVQFDFTFAAQGRLSGAVRDTNGQPLPGASVTACLEPDTPSAGCGGFFGSSDGAGSYTLDLPPGTYNVRASLGSVHGPVVQVVVSDGQTNPQDLTVEFGTLSGTVRDSFGDPLPNIAVPICLAPTIPAPGPPGPGSSCTGFTFTNAAGVYTRNLAPGTYNVAAFYGPSGFMTRADATVTVVAGQTTTQNLTLALGKVSGSVLNAAGQPIPGTVGFGACPAPGTDPSCPGVQFAIAGAAGNYTLRLRSGTYNVVGFTNNGGVVLSAATSITIATGEVISCNVQMPSAPVCRGSDDDGVTDTVEDAAPNGGDGNNDGTQDSEQPNVTSLPNATDSQYVTLESPDGTTLADVSASAVPLTPAPPAGATFPAGLLGFEVRGTSPGGTAEVTLHTLPGSSPSGYFKLHDGVWLDFSSNASIAGDAVTLTLTDGAVGDDDGLANGTIVDPGGPAVLPAGFDFDGFFSPVDNLPTLNAVKAGQAVPVKFSLGGDEGLDIFVADYPKSAEIPCESTALVDGVEQTVTAGGSSLSYDATTDMYTYVWKTSKSWAAGSCRQLVLELSDGSVHRANFKLK
jgi:Carboxypeptidase regulatory-like domain